MHVVVMGCGRVGASLAASLYRVGHEVAIIDRDPLAFDRLATDFPSERIVGMGFDRSVLIRAGIEKADAFAAVSSGDNSNIIGARVAREMFGVERVVARIYDAKRARVFERLGIPTIATVPWTTDRFLQAITQDSPSDSWRDPSGNVAVVAVNPHEDWMGRRTSALEDALRARVAFLIRYGAGVLPDARTVLQADDQVYIAAVAGRVAEAVALAEAPPPADL
ncbi:potassium channel family protein [Tomitella fengzijianii]|uniref:Trk system potassium uptake protein TrkA n=1 Tax=Tomitella fengzijianii TaxID=2597660 RepID=A0A516X3F9_9ACTN|nr:TrkA family potassium uptake protein [Tomitella fengzijianii]QDQ97597.1 TrkA family potassium uptake protein [Tomitella fengzijianii]